MFSLYDLRFVPELRLQRGRCATDVFSRVPSFAPAIAGCGKSLIDAERLEIPRTCSGLRKLFASCCARAALASFRRTAGMRCVGNGDRLRVFISSCTYAALLRRAQPGACIVVSCSSIVKTGAPNEHANYGAHDALAESWQMQLIEHKG